MPKPSHNIFALENSGLSAFLYGEVGTEPNGSILTVLSILARRDRDPWDQAIRWANLPRAAVIDSLAKIIAQTRLDTSVEGESRATAARLVLLLPSTTPGFGQAGSSLAVPATVRTTILLGCFVLGVVLISLLLTWSI